MRKALNTAIVILCLVALSGCVKSNGYVMDYYRECRYKLPFKYKTNYQSNVLYFEADYSIEQINQLLNNSGQSASLHEVGNGKTILIPVTENGITYYFVIHNRSNAENVSAYTLTGATLNIISGDISQDNAGDVPRQYVLLAPTHVLETTDDPNMPRVYADFEYISEFYRATGKHDVEIDEINKVLYFYCAGNPNLSWAEGQVIIRYVETETGNFLQFEPAS